MERNNPLFIALLPYIGSAVGLAAVGVGAWWLNRNVTAAQTARDLQLQQQAELNVAQSYSSQIQSQIMIERFTPVLWATVPAMALVGAYFLWKANREQARE
jgi:uncharacterized membrane protein (DUF2068 family)